MLADGSDSLFDTARAPFPRHFLRVEHFQGT